MSTTTPQDTTIEATEPTVTAADLGMTVGRKASAPASAPALIAELRTAVREWEELLKSPRKDGGAIKSKAQKAVRYSKILISDHGADVDALKVMVAGRKITELDDAAVIKALKIKA